MFAEIAYLSRTRFALKFKKLIGQTPLEYVTQWRMQLTRPRIIAFSDELVKIAQDLGYTSGAAFSRAFFSIFWGITHPIYKVVHESKTVAKIGHKNQAHFRANKKNGWVRILVDRLRRLWIFG